MRRILDVKRDGLVFSLVTQGCIGLESEIRRSGKRELVKAGHADLEGGGVGMESGGYGSEGRLLDWPGAGLVTEILAFWRVWRFIVFIAPNDMFYESPMYFGLSST
jgi:hypothetical protein